MLRSLYATAAVLTASGIPYAWTFLRRTNGALAIRCKKVLGAEGMDRKETVTEGAGAIEKARAVESGIEKSIALTYALDARAVEREKKESTEWLVKRWSFHNIIRTYVLAVGTLIGGCAIAVAQKV